MKSATTSVKISVIALAMTGGSFAIASDTGWYAGANVGQSRARIDDARINRSLLGSGFSSADISDDDRDVGYKLFAGYQMNRYFAVEGGYFDLGKFGFTARTVPAGTLNGEAKIRGLNLDLVGTLPITKRFSAFGRAGVNYADVRDRFSGTGAVQVVDSSPSKRDANYKLGLGLQYDFTDSLSMRTEVERYRINDAVGNRGDVDLFSVGLIYRFGAGSSSPAPRVMQEPVIMAEAPTPAPQPAAAVPAAPQPVLQNKVTFSADSLFDFDQATVKPAGRQALDKFAADLNGTDYDIIDVTGHTDRLGSVAYNRKLSTRRAEAVKAYLVGSAAIPAAKISATGKEASQPVTKAGECRGTKATKKLIACLQPDRRVDVTVSGLK